MSIVYRRFNRLYLSFIKGRCYGIQTRWCGIAFIEKWRRIFTFDVRKINKSEFNVNLRSLLLATTLTQSDNIFPS